MPVSLRKYLAPYGNYHDGHMGNPEIDDVVCEVGGGMSMIIRYRMRYDGKKCRDTFVTVPAAMMMDMRRWLSRHGLSTMRYSPEWWITDASMGDVLRRVEQYYGDDGIASFLREFVAALGEDIDSYVHADRWGRN